MDTREKIIAPRQAAELAQRLRSNGQTKIVVCGSFDVLRPAHVRHLADVRTVNPDATVMVVVSPLPAALLTERARAELVAGLSMVDYVVTGDDEGSVADFLSGLPPREIVARQAADEAEQRLLMDHVHSRQTA